MRARHEAAVSTYDSNSAVEFGPDRTGEIRRGIDNEVSAQSDLRVGGEQEICERKKALGRVNVRRFGEGNKEQPISHSARRRKGSAGRAASLVSPSPRFAAPLPRRSPCEGGSSSGTIQFRRMSPMRNFRTNFAQRRDHYQDLTDKIIAALEAGTAPWRRPWNPDACGGSTTPVNATTGHRYRGVNVFVLGMSPFALASGDPRWCSYRQALARRWQVRRAERATPVYFYKPIEIADKSDASEAETRRIPMLRTFSVFHASQIDGIPAFTPPAAVKTVPERIEDVEIILATSGVPVRIGGDRAYYNPATDHIQMPPYEAFESPAFRASVVLHELGHATGHPSRLNRDLSGRFGSSAYAREELRALSGQSAPVLH
jgi:antirestriction protein ArdC